MVISDSNESTLGSNTSNGESMSELKQKQNLAGAHFTIGKELYQNSKYKEALAVLIEACTIQESSFCTVGASEERNESIDLANIYFWISRTQFQLQDWDKAIAAYHSATRISHFAADRHEGPYPNEANDDTDCEGHTFDMIRQHVLDRLKLTDALIEEEEGKIIISVEDELQGDSKRMELEIDFNDAAFWYLKAIAKEEQRGILNPSTTDC